MDGLPSVIVMSSFSERLEAFVTEWHWNRSRFDFRGRWYDGVAVWCLSNIESKFNLKVVEKKVWTDDGK